ncbi:hypothetical protein F511_29307 [Dorcoceras hygrometricum]|uniref:Uncharacterized protein n=1 Tax=Dorcoceras hygrometricum TaxID=472368 RepID=A0A2Z7DEA5_9LAMI|nr:hypothetical protein F511_29307 [Dorcoceras hygrometricum]
MLKSVPSSVANTSTDLTKTEHQQPAQVYYPNSSRRTQQKLLKSSNPKLLKNERTTGQRREDIELFNYFALLQLIDLKLKTVKATEVNHTNLDSTSDLGAISNNSANSDLTLLRYPLAQSPNDVALKSRSKQTDLETKARSLIQICLNMLKSVPSSVANTSTDLTKTEHQQPAQVYYPNSSRRTQQKLLKSSNPKLLKNERTTGQRREDIELFNYFALLQLIDLKLKTVANTSTDLTKTEHQQPAQVYYPNSSRRTQQKLLKSSNPKLLKNERTTGQRREDIELFNYFALLQLIDLKLKTGINRKL